MNHKPADRARSVPRRDKQLKGAWSEQSRGERSGARLEADGRTAARRRMEMTRRTMLRRSAGGLATVAGSSAAGLRLELEQQLGGSSSSAKSSPDLPIASKKRPITLPIFSDNKPIPSGRSPEKGPLIIYDWAFYLSPAVVKSFEQKYGVKAQVTTFASIDEALNKVSSARSLPTCGCRTPDSTSSACPEQAGTAHQPQLHPEPRHCHQCRRSLVRQRCALHVTELHQHVRHWLAQ